MSPIENPPPPVFLFLNVVSVASALIILASSLPLGTLTLDAIGASISISIAILVCSVWYLFFRHCASVGKGLFYLIFLLSLLSLIGLIYTLTPTPAHAWDALDYWFARNFILPNQTFLGVPKTDLLPWQKAYLNKHPGALSVLSEWAAMKTLEGGGDVVRAIWLGAYGYVVFLVTTYVFLVTEKGGGAIISAVVLLTMPLLENHVFLFGYSEIFTTIFFMQATMTLHLLHDKRVPNVGFALLLLVNLLCLLATRNTGLLYALIILALVPLICFQSANFRRSTMFLGALMSFTMGALIISCSVNITVQDQMLVIDTGWRSVEVEVFDVVSVLWNQLYALFINSSFGIIFLTFIVICALTDWRHGQAEPIDTAIAVRNVHALTVFVGLIVFTLTQIFVDHVYQHAAPGMDTLNSRALMPIISVVAPLAGLSFSTLSIRVAICE